MARPCVARAGERGSNTDMADETPAEPAAVLVLVRDLMFSSRISATARALSREVKLLRDPAKLGGEPGRRLIVDLNQDGAIEAASRWRQGGGEVVGFVSHVDAETIAKARQAGVDRILSRSQFVQAMPDLLRD